MCQLLSSLFSVCREWYGWSEVDFILYYLHHRRRESAVWALLITCVTQWGVSSWTQLLINKLPAKWPHVWFSLFPSVSGTTGGVGWRGSGIRSRSQLWCLLVVNLAVVSWKNDSVVGRTYDKYVWTCTHPYHLLLHMVQLLWLFIWQMTTHVNVVLCPVSFLFFLRILAKTVFVVHHHYYDYFYWIFSFYYCTKLSRQYTLARFAHVVKHHCVHVFTSSSFLQSRETETMRESI